MKKPELYKKRKTLKFLLQKSLKRYLSIQKIFLFLQSKI